MTEANVRKRTPMKTLKIRRMAPRGPAPVLAPARTPVPPRSLALLLAAACLSALAVCPPAPGAAPGSGQVPSLDEYLTTAPPTAGLEDGFRDPPREARLRCFWWWLNGHVTEQALTRDLEAMKAKGYGGALIFDADGAGQFESTPVPAGPTFLTEPWRKLFRHALREARRLDLEMGLNIQSGWNLGGPNVTPEMAAKRLVWSATTAVGPGPLDAALPVPAHRDGYYRDIVVLACKRREAPAPPDDGGFRGASASSAQSDHPAALAVDGLEETFWVSGGKEPARGPTPGRPEWLQLDFARPVAASRVTVAGRPGYGPAECELLASDDGKTFRRVARFPVADGRAAEEGFPEVRAVSYRLTMLGSYDPLHPKAPRNVQVAELALRDGERRLPARAPARRPIRLLDIKTAREEFGGSAPDCSPLLEDHPAVPGEEDYRVPEIVKLTGKLETGGLDPDGRLTWSVPEGTWDVFRFGYTTTGARVSTSSAGWQGRVLDYLDPRAFDLYWEQVVDPLLEDAGDLAGTTLKYLHTDSWECGGANWSVGFEEEFRARRGYDPLAYLPVVAGKIVEDRDASNRFLNDLRRTIGDCILENNYRRFARRSHRHGIAIHPESGGPHGAPIDSLECLGNNDVPAGEFWARSYRHRVREEDRFFVKQPASAAHTYGKRLVAAEGFTTIGPHWEETIWDNLKPTFDEALCEGLNLLLWHTFTCSPPEMGLPGQEYFAGCHLNPQATWWEASGPFLAYINRCQFLLQRGLFVADVCHYYGDTVPNFAQLKKSDPARVLPGYDYDVATEEVVLERLSVRDGRLVLPDGMSYRLLVLPDRALMPLEVLRKLAGLVEAGATVIGPKPDRTPGLGGGPDADAELRRLAARLWGPCDGQEVKEHRVGKGRIVLGRTSREVLQEDGVPPDFEAVATTPGADIDYIHRREEKVDIYFVANQRDRAEELECVFRVAGKLPELWSPEAGDIRRLARYRALDGGRTAVPLRLDPYGSAFVVFREAATSPSASSPPGPDSAGARAPSVPAPVPDHVPGRAPGTAPAPVPVEGPWTVRFPEGWRAPESAVFEKLESWTERPEPGIRYFSGTASYLKEIDIPASLLAEGRGLSLDLGELRELAEVRLNGASLGILWKPPFAVDIAKAARPGANRLEVRVTNFWPNRIIGDLFLPEEERLTRHNTRKFTRESPLMRSGLFGPVRIVPAAIGGERPPPERPLPEPSAVERPAADPAAAGSR